MNRPRVLLNCACSLDGKLAAPDGHPMPFSDEVDWRRVHGLRADADAILVGVGTIVADDPSLKVKPDYAAVSPSHRLLRVVLDPKGRTPKSAKVVDGSAPTLVFVRVGTPTRWARADTVEIPEGPGGGLDLALVLAELRRRGVATVLVEGGAKVLRSFLDSDFVDQWTVYQAPVLVGGNGPSLFDGKPSMIGRRLHVEHVAPQGKGVLWTLRP